jgi:4-hydroxy-tetrahydrodipicolinate reductase
MSLRIVIVGYGRMGREIDALASKDAGCEIVERLDIHNNAAGEGIDVDRLKDVDVAIDFSTASATVANLPRLAGAGVNVVIGTTDWADHESSLKQIAANAGIGVVAASNFSLGVNIFLGMVERAAALMTPHSDFGAWIHETHHAAKIDAPSGTARTLENAMTSAGFRANVDMSSTRVGHVPGTHTVGFDGPSETITLTHTARDRTTFARGALEAARWIKGKSGWFTMRDVLGLGPQATSNEKDHS